MEVNWNTAALTGTAMLPEASLLPFALVSTESELGFTAYSALFLVLLFARFLT